MEKYKNDFIGFCKWAFPEYCNDFTEKRKKLALKMQHAVLYKAYKGFEENRGCGKTTLCKALAIWAIYYNHLHYITIFAYNDYWAESISKSICSMIIHSELGNYLGYNLKLPGNGTYFVEEKCICIFGNAIQCLGLNSSKKGLIFNIDHKGTTETIRPDFFIMDDCLSINHGEVEYKKYQSILCSDIMALGSHENNPLPGVIIYTKNL
ncbi:MAG: hypothetical protein WC373_01860 [Smithella sp.]|jgi:hypothetical protein